MIILYNSTAGCDVIVDGHVHTYWAGSGRTVDYGSLMLLDSDKELFPYLAWAAEE